MKEKADLVQGWLRKAQSDMTAMDASFEAGSLDAACFHAQQAAEKCLKAYLVRFDVEFPPTHNLMKLVELCRGVDASFESLASVVEPLTPYAVELRYDTEFWPSSEAAQEACSRARSARDFVLSRLPTGGA